NWDENVFTTERFIDRTLTTEIRDHIRQYVKKFLQDNAALFKWRVAKGRIRDGHGDLHLASVCVKDRRFQLFDCIEFAARFRCADVAAEVAFLEFATLCGGEKWARKRRFMGPAPTSAAAR